MSIARAPANCAAAVDGGGGESTAGAEFGWEFFVVSCDSLMEKGR